MVKHYLKFNGQKIFENKLNETVFENLTKNPLKNYNLFDFLHFKYLSM